MATFSKLPNEILLQILDLVILPADLEKFARTSKKTHAISDTRLKRHRELIQQYSTFKSPAFPGEVRDGALIGSIPDLLRKVVANSSRGPHIMHVASVAKLLREEITDSPIGHYVRKLDLDELINNEGRGDDQVLRNVDQTTKEQYRSRFRAHLSFLLFTALQSELMEMEDFDVHPGSIRWMMGRRDEDILVALLLPLLPNLTILSMVWDMDMGDRWSHEMICHAPAVRKPMLTNLKIVELVSQKGSEDRGSIMLKELRYVAVLPSLRSLSASGVFDGDDWVNDPIPPEISKVTNLKILRSCASSESVDDFLRGFQRLEVFFFNYRKPQAQNHDCGVFNPFLIRATLLSQSRTTLRHLTLVSHHIGLSFMGSLAEFEALEEIHTDWQFLLPAHCGLKVWPSQLLPPSLHTFKLRDRQGHGFDDYKQLIEGTVAAKATTCPRLDTVEILETPYSLKGGQPIEPMERYCRAVGICLLFSQIR